MTPEPHQELTVAAGETAAVSNGAFLDAPHAAAVVPEHIRRALEDVNQPARRSHMWMRIVGAVLLIALLAAGFAAVAGVGPSPGELLP